MPGPKADRAMTSMPTNEPIAGAPNEPTATGGGPMQRHATWRDRLQPVATAWSAAPNEATAGGRPALKALPAFVALATRGARARRGAFSRRGTKPLRDRQARDLQIVREKE